MGKASDRDDMAGSASLLPLPKQRTAAYLKGHIPSSATLQKLWRRKMTHMGEPPPE